MEEEHKSPTNPIPSPFMKREEEKEEERPSIGSRFA
jgi:hypothetical protein